MSNEPVVTAATIAGAIAAVIAALVSLGALDLTPEQQAALLAAVVAVLPIAMSIWARSKVTPVENPRDNTGAPLVRADGREPVSD